MTDPYSEMKVDDPIIAAEMLLAVHTASTILANAVPNDTAGMSKQSRSSIARAIGYALGDGPMLLQRALVAQHPQFDVESVGEFKTRLKQAGAANQAYWDLLDA